MSNILATIVAQKRKEIEVRKKNLTVDVMEGSSGFQREVISLAERFAAKKSTGIVAEFKRRSPSKGVINSSADIIEVVKAYEQYGAAAVSVLTDEEFFDGSTSDLVTARQHLTIPLLRKDFIVDEYQVIETRAMGADLILLIAACLSPAEVKALSRLAVSLGLEVLLELHEETELGHICDDTVHIGINNRNLSSFSVNLNRSQQLAEKIPAEKFRIAESGISSAEQVRNFRQQGFDGFLIGEFFMKERNPGEAFKKFAIELKPQLQ